MFGQLYFKLLNKILPNFRNHDIIEVSYSLNPALITQIYTFFL